MADSDPRGFMIALSVILMVLHLAFFIGYVVLSVASFKTFGRTVILSVSIYVILILAGTRTCLTKVNIITAFINTYLVETFIFVIIIFYIVFIFVKKKNNFLQKQR